MKYNSKISYLVKILLFTASFILTSCSDTPEKNCGHIFGDWIIISDSTCTKTGIKERICKKCNFLETATVELKKHNFGEEFIENSMSIKICKDCGFRIESTIPIELIDYSKYDWSNDDFEFYGIKKDGTEHKLTSDNEDNSSPMTISSTEYEYFYVNINMDKYKLFDRISGPYLKFYKQSNGYNHDLLWEEIIGKSETISIAKLLDIPATAGYTQAPFVYIFEITGENTEKHIATRFQKYFIVTN